MNPVMPGAGIPAASAEVFFDGLRTSELSDAAKPIEELYRKNTALVELVKAKLKKMSQLAKAAEKLEHQYRIARTQLFLRKLREKGLSFCYGPVGQSHVASEVVPIFVGDGRYITNVCPACFEEAFLKQWVERYRTRECRKENGAWQIKRDGGWTPLPKDSHDNTADDAYLVLPYELEEEYGLPPEIRISASCRLEYTNRDWLRMAEEGFW